jgi:hypothetical protein
VPRRRGLGPRLLAAVIRLNLILAFAAERQVVSRTGRMGHDFTLLASASLLGVLLCPQGARGASTEVAPIDGQEANTLGMVTAVRSMRHKKARLEVRLLEADGSSSVAADPISLFLVATNNGTSDVQEHVWRLPRGVERVRAIFETDCGVDVRVDVDGPGEPTSKHPTPKLTPRVFNLCFLGPKAQLLSRLQFSESGSKGAG